MEYNTANDIQISTKKCNVCEVVKPITEFYNSKTYKDGKGYRCKSCDNEAGIKYKKLHKDRHRELSRTRNMRHKYNLETNEFNNLLEKQNHLCAICETQGFKMHPNQWHNLVVDHDHKTDLVRGLLCHNCNRALGLLKDNIPALTRAINYLRKQLLDDE